MYTPTADVVQLQVSPVQLLIISFNCLRFGQFLSSQVGSTMPLLNGKELRVSFRRSMRPVSTKNMWPKILFFQRGKTMQWPGRKLELTKISDNLNPIIPALLTTLTVLSYSYCKLLRFNFPLYRAPWIGQQSWNI